MAPEEYNCAHGRCVELAQEGSGLCAWCCHADDVDAFRSRRCPHCGERFKAFGLEHDVECCDCEECINFRRARASHDESA